ncbi:hypothetical protein [Flavobacterium chungangensis]|uniref:Uncharacterized protein n=1 Tax=Flavobacterium chungangensis TaxID=2708132 RepID=A0ABV8ZJ67_9FLAO
MKIINKHHVLVEVRKIDENSILLKFVAKYKHDQNENVSILQIVGKGIATKIELINEYHLNFPTVIVDDGELTFYNGNLDESPDWGDWTSAFSLPFEKYDFV